MSNRSLTALGPSTQALREAEFHGFGPLDRAFHLKPPRKSTVRTLLILITLGTLLIGLSLWLVQLPNAPINALIGLFLVGFLLVSGCAGITYWALRQQSLGEREFACFTGGLVHVDKTGVSAFPCHASTLTVTPIRHIMGQRVSNQWEYVISNGSRTASAHTFFDGRTARELGDHLTQHFRPTR